MTSTGASVENGLALLLLLISPSVEITSASHFTTASAAFSSSSEITSASVSSASEISSGPITSASQVASATFSAASEISATSSGISFVSANCWMEFTTLAHLSATSHVTSASATMTSKRASLFFARMTILFRSIVFLPWSTSSASPVWHTVTISASHCWRSSSHWSTSSRIILWSEIAFVFVGRNSSSSASIRNWFIVVARWTVLHWWVVVRHVFTLVSATSWWVSLRWSIVVSGSMVHLVHILMLSAPIRMASLAWTHVEVIVASRQGLLVSIPVITWSSFVAAVRAWVVSLIEVTRRLIVTTSSTSSSTSSSSVASKTSTGLIAEFVVIDEVPEVVLVLALVLRSMAFLLVLLLVSSIPLSGLLLVRIIILFVLVVSVPTLVRVFIFLLFVRWRVKNFRTPFLLSAFFCGLVGVRSWACTLFLWLWLLISRVTFIEGILR